MKKIFFTPGPSQLYPILRQHIQSALDEDIGSISHRSQEFKNLFSEAVLNLRKLMDIPQSLSIFFLSSGTECMERIIENCVEKKSFHFVNGSFSDRFYKTAQELKKQPDKIEADLGEGFDFKQTKIPYDSELLCFTHNETSTGVMLPLEEIYLLKENNPNKLIALDIVSSAPYPKIKFEYFDCVFFSVQKGFGLPAGLGVLILSQKAIDKANQMQNQKLNIGSFHNFPTLLQYGLKNQTLETPPVLHIYLLNEVIKDMLKTGIKTIREDTDNKANLLYEFLDSHKIWKAFVKVKKYRSPTIIVMQTDKQTEAIKNYLKKLNLIAGDGYGENKNVQIRIANFPAISVENIIQLIKCLQNYPEKTSY